jgi:DNA-binding transcriptional MerR regulator
MKDKRQYLLGEAAGVLGCKPYQITYLLAIRKIPEPIRIGGRRIFTTTDLKRIAKLLGGTP